MVSSQKVRLHLPPAQQHTTDNLGVQIQEARAGRVESAKDITPAMTGTHEVLGARVGDTDEGAACDWQTDFFGAFTIPWEPAVLIFIHLS